MEHAKIDDQIFSPLSTATGGGTVELPTTGAQCPVVLEKVPSEGS